MNDLLIISKINLHLSKIGIRSPPLSKGRKKFEFKNPLFSIDATIIDLCATMFDWATYRKTKGAVKLHLLLDHEGYLPVFTHLTEGNVHEVNMAKDLSLPAGSIVAMDRLLAVKEKAEPAIARKFLSLLDQQVDLVFYDITSTYFEGDRSIEEDDVRRYGYNRDGRFDRRQITIGIVMTRDGIPLCHHVFPGNTVDRPPWSKWCGI